MADEKVAPSTTQTESTATEQTADVAAIPLAEASTTETQATEEATKDEKGPIPYNRFAEINDQRKAAETQIEELKQQLEQAQTIKPATSTAVTADLTEPPEHLSQREKVDFYVRQSAGNMIQEQLGMTLGEAQTLLKTVPGVSDATYEVQWRNMCTAKGLDPADRLTQDLTRGLVKSSGHTPEDALTMVADLMAKKKAATSETAPQIMENGATAHTMTEENVDFVWDMRDARKLAEQGKRVSNANAVDILKAAAERRKKAAG